MSFWTKKLRPIVKVAARAVAAVYTGGASEALLAAAGQSGFGISDLLPAGAQDVVEDAKAAGNELIAQKAAQYPQITALVGSYRSLRREPAVTPDYGPPSSELEEEEPLELEEEEDFE